MPKLILTLKGRELKSTEIAQPELTIGRDPDDTIFIDNIGISRSHVKIRVTSQGDIFAIDNQSRNGTFINDKKITSRHKLVNGDEIQLAKYRVKFSSTGAPLNLHKMRENAKVSVGKPQAKGSIGSQGTLSFSPDEIKNIIKAGDQNKEKPGSDQQAGRSPAKGSPKTPSPASQRGENNNLVLVMGLVIVILLLFIILLVLIKRM